MTAPVHERTKRPRRGDRLAGLPGIALDRSRGCASRVVQCRCRRRMLKRRVTS